MNEFTLEDSMNDDMDDSVDSSPAEPIEEAPDETLADDPTDNVGELDEDESKEQWKHDYESDTKPAEDDEDDSLRHVANDGLVIGRRNPDVPTR